MALGSTKIRTKGASIRVLVSGHSVMLGWAPSQRFACTTTAGLGLPELQHAITDLPSLLGADGFQLLSIAISHALRAGAYPQAHRDPFDRMLAAQAELEQLVLVTADSQLSAFPCRRLWEA
jgi:PIN domain nuclease of toxin-antitoxin system